MNLPHRKPLPGYIPPPAPSYMNAPSIQQHSTTRSPSGNSMNMAPHAVSNTALYTAPQQPQQPQQPLDPQFTRRTLSNATSSTSSTTNTNRPQSLHRAPTNPSSSNPASLPRRSTSSRSTTSVSPTSYVALMRKQKATVWCDRAQHEDPRILAAQRAAKLRAAMDVAGGHNHAPPGRAGTGGSGMVGGVRSKMRHHGAPKASTYNSANLSGAGVPMRLSATEVDEGESDEEASAAAAQNHPNSRFHSRNGSGRSSLGSGYRGSSSQLGAGHGYSLNTATPPNGHSPVEGMGDLAEEETPMPGQYGTQSADYFGQPGGQGDSGSSGEREASFGGVGLLPPPGTARKPELERKTSEELRRRGSVDDRTMTMSGVRLFVANPDLSD